MSVFFIIGGFIAGALITKWWYYDGIAISSALKKGKQALLYNRGNPNALEAFRILSEGHQKMRQIKPRLEVIKDDEQR